MRRRRFKPRPRFDNVAKKPRHESLSLQIGKATVTFNRARTLNLVVGCNGSGKSTLLKRIQDASDPGRRRVEERSRIDRYRATAGLSELNDEQCDVPAANEAFIEITGIDITDESFWPQGQLGLSDGFQRLYYVLLSVTAGKGGVVLFDEIENGIDRKYFKKFLSHLFELADESNAQVFCSTLSRTLMREFAKFAERKPDQTNCIFVVEDGSALVEWNPTRLLQALENGEV